MIIFVNGQETQISNGHTAHDLLLDLGFETRPVAVEVNKEVIPRALLPESGSLVSMIKSRLLRSLAAVENSTNHPIEEITKRYGTYE